MSNRNQGEGDRESARRYDEHLKDFIGSGKVNPAARSAESFVEQHPVEAQSAEQRAKRGPRGGWPALDELVRAGVGVIERVRARLAKK